MNKTITVAEWKERIRLFSLENRRRISAIAFNNMTLVEGGKFSNLVYDSVGNGNDLVITLESPDDTFQYTISDAVAISIKYSQDRLVSILEIINQNEESTCLIFTST